MAEPPFRFLAVDWSGKVKGAEESIWLAEAADGQLVTLENGRERNDLVNHLIAIAALQPRVVVGIDFAFSMPAWYLMHHFANDTPQFWEIVACAGDSWLDMCPWPFFGQKGKPKPLDCDLFRATEKPPAGAKSVFQIGGAGAVGVGSIRGMPLLLRLRSAGWKIWPFDPPGFPLAVEIYPRLLTGKIHKTAWKMRLAYMTKCFPDLNPCFAERAAGSEDAFDAAVSALVMTQHRDELLNLPWPVEADVQREGQIWNPWK